MILKLATNISGKVAIDFMEKLKWDNSDCLIDFLSDLDLPSEETSKSYESIWQFLYRQSKKENIANITKNSLSYLHAINDEHLAGVTLGFLHHRMKEDFDNSLMYCDLALKIAQITTLSAYPLPT